MMSPRWLTTGVPARSSGSPRSHAPKEPAASGTRAKPEGTREALLEAIVRADVAIRREPRVARGEGDRSGISRRRGGRRRRGGGRARRGRGRRLEVIGRIGCADGGGGSTGRVHPSSSIPSIHRRRRILHEPPWALIARPGSGVTESAENGRRGGIFRVRKDARARRRRSLRKKFRPVRPWRLCVDLRAPISRSRSRFQWRGAAWQSTSVMSRVDWWHSHLSSWQEITSTPAS